jgi:hypothetical protein
LRLDPPAHLEESSLLPLLLPPPQTIATLPGKLMIMPQLVECESEILVVGSTDTSSAHLVVVRLADLWLGGPAASLTSIGDNCLFFGKGMPSVSGNSFVLCSTVSGRVMQYNLSDGTSSLAACDGDIFRSPPPCPHTIALHLLTCCYRYFWNKGLIYCCRTMPPWGRKRKWRLGA